MTDAFRPELTAFYSENLGVEILTMQSFQAQILYCRDEFTGLKDLKGRKVRGSGASQADFVEYFGGMAVSLSFGEVQQGLQQVLWEDTRPNGTKARISYIRYRSIGELG